jgi:flagellar biosynthesis protein FliR
LSVDLVRQSLVLATHVAAPVLATMAVVGTAAGLVERALPRLNMLAVGLPVRMLVGLLVLGLSLSSIADLVDSTLPDTVLNIRRVLMGSSGGFDE